jgi:hypothetical protein
MLFVRRRLLILFIVSRFINFVLVIIMCLVFGMLRIIWLVVVVIIVLVVIIIVIIMLIVVVIVVIVIVLRSIRIVIFVVFFLSLLFLVLCSLHVFLSPSLFFVFLHSHHFFEGTQPSIRVNRWLFSFLLSLFIFLLIDRLLVL